MQYDHRNWSGFIIEKWPVVRNFDATGALLPGNCTSLIWVVELPSVSLKILSTLSMCFALLWEVFTQSQICSHIFHKVLEFWLFPCFERNLRHFVKIYKKKKLIKKEKNELDLNYPRPCCPAWASQTASFLQLHCKQTVFE